MAQQQTNMPAGFSGLTRYGEGYESKFNLKPTHVIVFILFIIGMRVLIPFLV